MKNIGVKIRNVINGFMFVNTFTSFKNIKCNWWHVMFSLPGEFSQLSSVHSYFISITRLFHNYDQLSSYKYRIVEKEWGGLKKNLKQRIFLLKKYSQLHLQLTSTYSQQLTFNLLTTDCGNTEWMSDLDTLSAPSPSLQCWLCKRKYNA